MENYQRQTKILAPLFKTYGPDQIRALKPLIDVFGRVLRTQSPYQMLLYNSVSNEPAPLEYEAPPQPAAAGEEASMQHLIDFWEQIKNKFFCIPDDRIRALQSPLYCLEEREIEFFNNGQLLSIHEVMKHDVDQQVKVGCNCSQFSAVMYPNPNPSLQLDSFQKGIYYMSPYYIPIDPVIEMERLSVYRQLVKLGSLLIGQLMRQRLNELFELPNTDVDKNSIFVNQIQKFFIKRWPEGQRCEHFKQENQNAFADIGDKRIPQNDFGEAVERLEFVRRLKENLREKTVDKLT